jgi:subfamily B ATP-binding cassette protein MsbA
MKKFFRIISYIKEYKAYMGWYSLFITLSIVFGLFSLGMLMPFMDLIFGSKELTGATISAATPGATSNIKDLVYGFLHC